MLYKIHILPAHRLRAEDATLTVSVIAIALSNQYFVEIFKKCRQFRIDINKKKSGFRKHAPGFYASNIAEFTTVH